MKHLSYSSQRNSIRFDSLFINFTRSLNWFIERFAVNARVLIVVILCRDWAHLLGLIANGSIPHWLVIIESAYYDRLRCWLHLSLTQLSYELCKQSMQQVLIYMLCVCVCIYIYSWSASCSKQSGRVQKVCPLCH